MINCVIVDDEPIAAEIIEDYVIKTDELDLIKTFNSPTQALKFINTDHSISLLFLDINMPNINGIEFLKLLERPIDIIFTTAYGEYAVESYSLGAIDYLLKPIRYSRFLQAIQKFISLTDQSTVSDYLIVKSGYQYKKISIADILYIKSDSNNVKIILKHDEIISVLNLKDLEQKLSSSKFIRVHRSYIVSLKHVESFDNDFVKILNKQIPISKTYQENLKKYIL